MQAINQQTDGLENELESKVTWSMVIPAQFQILPQKSIYMNLRVTFYQVSKTLLKYSEYYILSWPKSWKLIDRCLPTVFYFCYRWNRSIISNHGLSHFIVSTYSLICV